MIYLIGGAPRSGKTTLAKKLSDKLHIPWISIDTLETVISKYVSKKDYTSSFPKNILREQTKQSNDLMYSQYTDKEITRAYIRQARTSWPAIEAFVASEIRNNNNFILEGHQLHPKIVSTLLKKYKNKIRAVFLGRGEAKIIISSATSFSTKNDWFTKKTKNKDIYPYIAQMIITYSNFFQSEAKKYKQKYFNVDKGFNKVLSIALKLIQ